MFLIVIICLINLFISFMNARSCGLIWCESKAIGGFIRVLVWCGAIQSAIGFTSVYMVIASFIAYQTGYLSRSDILALMYLFYVLLIIPLIGTCLVITLSSWIRLARERSLASLGIAGWNTFAQVRNMYYAYHSFGPAVESVAKLIFGGKNNKRKVSIIMLVIFVLVLGIATTTVIIRRYAGELGIPKSLKFKYQTEILPALRHTKDEMEGEGCR